MRIRVFGSNDCEVCKRLLTAMHAVGVSYFYVDAEDDKNDAICEAYGIEELPHIQILDGNRTVWDHTGYISPLQLQKIASRKT